MLAATAVYALVVLQPWAEGFDFYRLDGIWYCERTSSWLGIIVVNHDSPGNLKYIVRLRTPDNTINNAKPSVDLSMEPLPQNKSKTLPHRRQPGEEIKGESKIETYEDTVKNLVQ